MEADLNLLETARRCELYGVKMHNVKVRVRYVERGAAMWTMNYLRLVLL